MNVNDLNKNIIKVSFSDLSEYDNWDPIFWISMNQYINQYKALGKDKAVEFVAERVKKMGIENYNALKNISDKNHFGVPEFKNAIDVNKLTLIGSTKIIVLMDLIQSKSKIRKQELEKQLKELQNKIALLDESVEKNGTTLKTIKTLEDFEELVGEKNLKGVLQVLKRLG